jgi:hypothetical protein
VAAVPEGPAAARAARVGLREQVGPRGLARVQAKPNREAPRMLQARAVQARPAVTWVRGQAHRALGRSQAAVETSTSNIQNGSKPSEPIGPAQLALPFQMAGALALAVQHRAGFTSSFPFYHYPIVPGTSGDSSKNIQFMNSRRREPHVNSRKSDPSLQ